VAGKLAASRCLVSCWPMSSRTRRHAGGGPAWSVQIRRSKVAMSRGVVLVVRSGTSASAAISRRRTRSSSSAECGCSFQAHIASQLAKPAAWPMELTIVRRSAVMTVPLRPSRTELAFTASTPSRSSSASVAVLSLTVSMATTRSRSEASASSLNSEKPTFPGVRSAARSVTRCRGSSRPSANWVSASKATLTLNTDALTAGRSASTATSCPPSSDCTQS